MNPAFLNPEFLSAPVLVAVPEKLKSALIIVCAVIYVLCGLILMLAILLQESKGGGLAALGGTRAESAFGASNPLRKLTAIVSVIFLLLAGGLSLTLAPSQASVLDKGEKPPAPKSENSAPAAPAPAPTPKPTSAEADIPSEDLQEAPPEPAKPEKPAPVPEGKKGP